MREAQAEASERRQHERLRVLESGLIFTGDACLDCQVIDVSLTGARIRPVGDMSRIDGRCRFKLAGLGVFDAAVRWRGEDAAGLEFLTKPHVVAARCEPLLGQIAA